MPPAIGTLEIERVLHVAGRMVGRHVERFEVVIVVFDFGAFENLVAHAREDVLDLLTHLHERMHAPERQPSAGQRHVHRAGRHLRRLQFLRRVGERRFDLLLQRVDERAELALGLRRGQRAQASSAGR